MARRFVAFRRAGNQVLKWLSKAWRYLARNLKNKANWHGMRLVRVDTWFLSSKKRLTCGNVVAELPSSIGSWTCRHQHGRDVNEAMNIKAEWLSKLMVAELFVSTYGGSRNTDVCSEAGNPLRHVMERSREFHLTSDGRVNDDRWSLPKHWWNETRI